MAYVVESKFEARVVHEALNTKEARISIILCAALLDSTLERALRRRFIDNKESADSLFDSTNGGLGSYGAKVHLGCLLGMYNTIEKSALSAIGRIRNLFAHKIMGDEHVFKTDDFKKAFAKLSLHKGRSHYPGLEQLEISGSTIPKPKNDTDVARIILANYRIMQHKLVLDQFYHQSNSNVPASPEDIIKELDKNHGSREAWFQKSQGLYLLGPQNM